MGGQRVQAAVHGHVHHDAVHAGRVVRHWADLADRARDENWARPNPLLQATYGIGRE